MPSVQENKDMWDGGYGWPSAGDEWSVPWGGSSLQWYGTLLPRIHRFLPAATILEIACGYGRWTQYLKNHSSQLIAVDLSRQCVEACQRRFEDSTHISYFVNDGKSLDMIESSSVDFIFSFDSLVHADETVIKSYLNQMPRILKKDGAAFIHHSNLGEYAYYQKFIDIPMLGGLLRRMGGIEHLHLRDFSVTASKVEQIARECGLRCINQETTTWLTKRTLIDCMSTIVRSDSRWSRGNRVLRNTAFSNEAFYLSKLSRLYGDVPGG